MDYAQTLRWLERQLQQCRTTHLRCNGRAEILQDNEAVHTPQEEHERQTQWPLPTRLLDVGDSDHPIRLWESASSAKGEYACLSHCWGSHQLLRTLIGNLEAFKHDGIPWDQLPKTFQEAITFTRSLGLQYLWIDSLCIVQDDISDWNKEAANMAAIYQNSFITLAATDAANSREGLFHYAPRK